MCELLHTSNHRYLMDTITDLYISAHSDCRSPPDPGRGGGDLALGYRWGERDPVSDSGPIEATPASALAVLDLKIQPGAEPMGEKKLPWMNQHLPELLTLAVLAAFGWGLLWRRVTTYSSVSLQPPAP